jgi:hypothetical protein
MSLLPIVDIIGGIIDKVIPDANERLRLRSELMKYADAEAARASSERIAQTEVNKVEAGNSSLFVAGWRPAVGWACVAGFSYTVILAPIAQAVFGLQTAPITETAFLRDVLLGMLGINVLARSVEKVKGVAQNTLTGTEATATPSTPQVENKGEKQKKKILGIAPWPF